ncbi:MAG: hypothetical protein UZ01_01529 [Candidatus Brocadia sinica]|nr:MAG: hypothetical protein UZ01_01529 [Candidatus Brocadia sinica]
MEGYRHLNILISGKTYNALKETSYKLGKPISEIVRNGITLVLKSKDCKCSERSGNG